MPTREIFVSNHFSDNKCQVQNMIVAFGLWHFKTCCFNGLVFLVEWTVNTIFLFDYQTLHSTYTDFKTYLEHVVVTV